MFFSGTVLHRDGSHGHELNRRIGRAKADFLILSKVWSHSACTWRRKLRIFNALIESKLLYSLSAMCLNVAELRRLDGFQNRCVRKIIGIKPSFISRVSNAAVLEKAGHQPASKMLRKRSLQLLGKILRSPETHPLYSVSFKTETSIPLVDWYVRRRGRPHKEWVPDVTRQAIAIAQNWEHLQFLTSSKALWNHTLFNHFGF